MTDTVFSGLLVSGTDVDPDTDGDRAHVRHLFGDDPQAVGTNGFSDVALLIGTYFHAYLCGGNRKIRTKVAGRVRELF
jgi:hypothetical protein